MSERHKQAASPNAPPRAPPEYRFLPRIARPLSLPGGKVAIADMANAFGVTHRTLHFYEEKGLIASGRIGLMRVYEHADIRRMAVINVCREAGMPVAVIQDLMADLCRSTSQQEADAVFAAALASRKRELTADMSTLHRQLQQVNELLENTAPGDEPPLNDNQHERALTEQEYRCLVLMTEGLSTQRIARTIDIAEDDAKSIEAAIIQKLDANNRFQAIAKAVLLGIVHI
ncbi:MerR family transcriptional regulator [Rhizobium metallidurans]|uniref:DNA-binding transcriptional MerR regulator n=1 Tax=Rhizobium metallidurans TaxID=1265931 RepID=A0A7W6CQL9_9HYPH|nr:MerR family transcriptional regulator [Rhizobium metallidurans]MBB3963333.1 DNA-binding transcriptional MerR regulator [Rhizobium metallidurans]